MTNKCRKISLYLNLKVQDSQTMISGYAYDDNYKIRLSDDVKANEEMKDE